MEKLIILGTGSGITINCYSLSALLKNNVYVPNDLDEIEL